MANHDGTEYYGYRPIMDDVTMVIKSATKKKLMDLGISEEVAHLLADDRKWDDVKNLNKPQLKHLLGVDEPINDILAKIQGSWKPPVTNKWYWWTPMDIQTLLRIMPGNNWVKEPLINQIFIGAPLLHIGYVYRLGIDTPESIKAPRYQLGIITDIREEPGTEGENNGYLIDVKWIKSTIPNKRAHQQDGLPSSTGIEWINDAVDKSPNLCWDPNPEPKEWKQTNPNWKRGKGMYGPQTLVHSREHSNAPGQQLADAFVVLLNRHPEDPQSEDGTTTDPWPENPSASRTFDKKMQDQSGDPITNPEDIRKLFQSWGQHHVFDEAHNQVLPHFKSAHLRLAINWHFFDQHVGV